MTLAEENSDFLSVEELPASVREALRSTLEPNEGILAWFEPNLDELLHFGSGIVILTNRAVLGYQPVTEDAKLFRAFAGGPLSQCFVSMASLVSELEQR